MATFIEFMQMNGHGIYVWASYGASLLVFVGLVFWFKSMHKSALKQIVQQTAQKAPNKRTLKVSSENN